MTIDEVVDHYGTMAKAAVALDKSTRTLEAWKQNGIPRMVQLALETMTKGKLKAAKELKA
jgi:hypothetical protein